ncbi:tetratricopeptide repeat protein 7B isoform X3 [Strongylocentrotus purpuratus]|uniref:Tetratricopeptide repeat protein 7 N-terminal domain-containing protein n=1 Tax=Strongylocentrotus purpuratus TaxID=7668 RepID=A0A7M7PPN1_STRPU|nr:tetratricopeptide repeat protein 7B isoform X3 [Strongylocentrotus purpuratus]|eukprot:XP_011677034.1 PREDICTED: tetratricopeptide repeat protein 7B isoform X1 [Strongylocentrotus purpuratus]
MAANRKAVSRVESDIEKYRSECNWERIREVVNQNRVKSPHLEVLLHLATGECELELYLIQNPPNHETAAKAKKELSSARSHLLLAAKGAKHILYAESHLLLSKVHLAMGEYEEAIKNLDKAKLDDMASQEAPCTRLKIMAEAFAVRGMCMEKLADKQGDKKKREEHAEEIIANYERAGDLALYYLQEIEKGQQTNTTSSSSSSLGSGSHMVGPVLETAVQRAPLIYIQQGKMDQGINRFRHILKAVETRTSQNIRTTLARELAEVLLRGVCEHRYTPPSVDGREERTGSLSRSSVSGGSASSLRPASSRGSLKPKLYTMESLFVPKSVGEEALLLLLISELQVNRDVVLSRSKEYSQSRQHTFFNATAVYDLLTIALTRRAQYQMLSETLDRTMRFSFEEFHLWMQFALSLISSGKFDRALQVLRGCSNVQPDNVTVLLLAAKVCLQHLQQLEEGLEFASKAVEVGKQPLAPRCHMMKGLAYGMMALEATRQDKRCELQRKSLSCFKQATSLDPDDHMAQFQMAMQLALSRQIPEALQRVRLALQLCADDLQSLHLLALLLSAQKQYTEALSVLEAAVLQYPDDFNLQFTKAKLEEVHLGPEEALVTCKQMLEHWRVGYEAVQHSSSSRGTGLIERVTSDRRSLVQMHLAEYSDRDSDARSERGKSSIHNSLAASRVEHALSEVASSSGSFIPKTGSQQLWMIQAHIWLAIAELYLSLERPEEAKACVQEASSIFPLSHQVMHTRGCIHEHNGEWDDAKQGYDSALAINPSHITSLQNLGCVYTQQGNLLMAERILREAVNMDPTSHQAWISLGNVLQASGQCEAAGECMLTGLQLESTNPILPFSTIPRSL